jgi:hypothetical protein
MSLTFDERVAVATRWQQVARKDIKVVVNVGHTSINDCKALAVHAAMAGVYAISAMPPCYYKPATIGDLVEFYAQIASAAPNVPFYAYHTPGLTGVNFKMIQFLEIAAKKIPSLAGIKYNHNDFMDYAQCRSFGNGKHTTTSTTLYWVDTPRTTAVIDSPGFQEFGLNHIEPMHLAGLMPDIKAHASDCKFYNCSHLHEPGCGVIAALQKASDGFLPPGPSEISISRYKIYSDLFAELSQKRY